MFSLTVEVSQLNVLKSGKKNKNLLHIEVKIIRSFFAYNI